jgi:hypothetical protein
MLERAISAVSCLYMGKMNNDDHMYNYGLDLYGTAIRSVKNNIYRNAWNAEIVYTAVIFQELEVRRDRGCPQNDWKTDLT